MRSYITVDDYINYVKTRTSTKFKDKPYKTLFLTWLDLHEEEDTFKVTTEDTTEADLKELDIVANRRMFKFWNDYYDILTSIEAVDGYTKTGTINITNSGKDQHIKEVTPEGKSKVTVKNSGGITNSGSNENTEFGNGYNTTVLGNDSTALGKSQGTTSNTETDTRQSVTEEEFDGRIDTTEEEKNYGRKITTGSTFTDTSKQLDILFQRIKGIKLYDALDAYLQPILHSNYGGI